MGCGTSKGANAKGSHPKKQRQKHEELKDEEEPIADHEIRSSEDEPISDSDDSGVSDADVRQSKLANNDSDNDLVFEVEDVGEGDQFMACKPWIGALVAPNNKPKIDNSIPDAELELEYVYGYRCQDSRQNCYYTQANEVVYMSAALGIVLKPEENTQKFFGGGLAKENKAHTDDISALAISNDRSTVITGQKGKQPLVCIWDATSCDLKKSLKQRKNTRAVSAAGFSFNDKFAATVGQDNDHSLFVWDVKKGKQVYTDKTGPDKVMDLAWSMKEDEYKICTVGVKHIVFWYFDANCGFQKKKKGIFGSAGKMTNFTSVQFSAEGTAFTGGTNGSIFKWADRNLKKSAKIHAKGVHTIRIVEDHLYSGGADNKIFQLSFNFEKLKTFETEACPRSLDVDDGKILCGHRNGDIAEYSLEDESSKVVLMRGHSDGEVWGLCQDAKTGKIVTCGDDNKVMIWDFKNRKCVNIAIFSEKAGKKPKTGGASTLSTLPPNQQCRSVTINNGGNRHLAVSNNEGMVQIRASVDDPNKVVHTMTDAKEWNEAMQYSPNGQFLAVGSHDNNIYIYEVNNKYKLMGKCNKHGSFITGLDWSRDSSYIHSNCGAYELLFFQIPGCKQDPSGGSSTRDEEWSNWSLRIGWPVQGIYPDGTDGSHVNGTDRSKSGEILATADDWGNVNLFRYPNMEGAEYKAYCGHSEHVVRALFGQDDKRLFSVGGYDQTVMQWKVKSG